MLFMNAKQVKYFKIRTKEIDIANSEKVEVVL